MGSLIRFLAIATSAIVLLAFALFVAQQSPAHELVDDANDVLVAPFGVLIDSGNNWVQHGVSTLLALLIYGVGLGFVANLLPKQRSHGGDWRAAQP